MKFKILRKYIIIIVIILFVAFLVEGYTPIPKLGQGHIDLSQPLIWDMNGSACVTTDGGNHFTLYNFRDKRGKIIGVPSFAFWHNSIVYWSAHDRAICVQSAAGQPKWFMFTVYFAQYKSAIDPYNFTVLPSPDGVTLNLGQVKSFSINLATGTASCIPNAVVAETAENTHDMAVLTPAHQIELRSSASTTILAAEEVQRFGRPSYWYYDFQTHYLYLTSGGIVRSIDTTNSFNAFLHSFDISTPSDTLTFDIMPQNSQHEIWVSVMSKVDGSSEMYLLAYTKNGHLIGTRLAADAILSPVLSANKQQIMLLKHLTNEGSRN